jgi:adenylate kinase
MGCYLIFFYFFALEIMWSASLSQLAEIVNQGKLVSDEIIINLLSKRLKKGEDQGESGFILDGFPRTVNQAVRIFYAMSNCFLFVHFSNY